MKLWHRPAHRGHDRRCSPRAGVVAPHRSSRPWPAGLRRARRDHERQHPRGRDPPGRLPVPRRPHRHRPGPDGGARRRRDGNLSVGVLTGLRASLRGTAGRRRLVPLAGPAGRAPGRWPGRRPQRGPRGGHPDQRVHRDAGETMTIVAGARCASPTAPAPTRATARAWSGSAGPPRPADRLHRRPRRRRIGLDVLRARVSGRTLSPAAATRSRPGCRPFERPQRRRGPRALRAPRRGGRGADRRAVRKRERQCRRRPPAAELRGTDHRRRGPYRSCGGGSSAPVGLFIVRLSIAQAQYNINPRSGGPGRRSRRARRRAPRPSASGRVRHEVGRSLVKVFPGVRALDGVNLDLVPAPCRRPL